MQTLTEIAEELNCRTQAITQYMGRSEFSRINRIRKGFKVFFDITEEEKKLLKFYIDNAKKRSGHLR